MTESAIDSQDTLLSKAQAWAAWFAAAATDADQRAQQFADEAQRAHDQIDIMIEQGVEAGLGLKSLSVDGSEVTLSVTTAGIAEATVLTMLDGLADMLGDSPNYVEFELRCRGKTPVCVCVRRMGHPTPHELRETAERERDAARADVAHLRAELDRLATPSFTEPKAR